MGEKRKKKRITSAAGEDLCISVPNPFRCPISLDVMRSPVSLSTGITYDRTSIQKWLDGGHNTCPATMQVLNSKDFVPNHTLRRLIQLWYDSAHALANDSVPSGEEARELIAEMRRGSSSATTAENLEKLARFGAESDDNRRYLVRLEGFIALVVELTCNVDGDLAERGLKITAQIVSEEVNMVRELMLKSCGGRDCVFSLLRFLSEDSSSDAKMAAVQVLEIITSDAESKLLIAEKEGVLPQLVKSVDRGTNPSVMEAVLSCLISLSRVNRVKVKLVHLGVVAVVTKLLTGPNMSAISIERMLKLLETVSSCKEGRRKICEDPMCVPAILTKMMKVSEAATEHAVSILRTMCCVVRDVKAQEAVAMNNGVTKVLLVIQSNCPASVRQMAGDILKIFRGDSQLRLSNYDTESTHITPC